MHYVNNTYDCANYFNSYDKHMVGPTSSKVNLEHVPRERLTITMNGLDDPYVGPWWGFTHPQKVKREACGPRRHHTGSGWFLGCQMRSDF